MVRTNKHKKGGYKSKTSKRSLSKSSKRKMLHSKRKQMKTKQHKKSQKGGKYRKTHTRKMKGGNTFKKVVPFLPPGGGAKTGNAFPHEYYTLNQYSEGKTPGFVDQQNVPPQLGGGLVDYIPRDLVDLGRTITGGVATTWNTYQGQKTPTSVKDPIAFQQPALKKNASLNDYTPDVQGILNSSYETAARV